MLDLIFPTFNFAITYAQKLVADVPDEQMCAQPVPGRVMNHAAWTMGHLAWANDNGLSFIGHKPQLGHLKELFGMTTKPANDRSLYPSKDELLAALSDAHQRLAAAAQNVSSDVLGQPAPERMRHRFPTVGTLLAGLMSSHYSNHLGQLSAWRRAMGYPSVF